jgi:hypothetical protein
MTINTILKQIISLEEYPIEYVLAKQFILAGIRSEAELQEALKSESKISMGMRWKIQNAYRDIVVTEIVDISRVLML